MHAIVEELAALIEAHGWQGAFQAAITEAQSHDVHSIKGIQTLHDYLIWIDALVAWAPRERGDTQFINNRLSEFYFFLDQEPVKSLQSPIRPDDAMQALTPLSHWINDYARAWGRYLDTPDSAKAVESFRTNSLFNWDEYMPPPSGYFTFNQFFARHVKPGMRPIAGLCDDAGLVNATDATFVGWWQVSEQSTITAKGLHWSIHQLLEGSAYANRFRGGVFTHSFLNTFDYHRWHAPARGTVLEARVIQGQTFMDICVKDTIVNGQAAHVLDAQDGTGYQFVQTRGLVVLDSPIGLVACLPIGMAQVSSVVITAEVGQALHKGEELGYFQFGGSDFVMVFERASNVQIDGQPNVHYNQGSAAGRAYPYGLKGSRHRSM